LFFCGNKQLNFELNEQNISIDNELLLLENIEESQISLEVLQNLL